MTTIDKVDVAVRHIDEAVKALRLAVPGELLAAAYMLEAAGGILCDWLFDELRRDDAEDVDEGLVAGEEDVDADLVAVAADVDADLVAVAADDIPY